MAESVGEIKPFEQRIDTLAQLTKHLPTEKSKQLLTRHHLKEHYEQNSPYLPTIGLEVETFRSRMPSGELDFDAIAEVEAAGIKRDKGDSFPVKGKEGKWEVALEAVQGTQVLLMREIQELQKRGLIHLTPKVSETRYRSSYPVHFTLGKLKRDFPDLFSRKDRMFFEGDHYTEDELRTTIDDWVQYKDNSKHENVWKREHMFSDCYVLARIFDATLYTTSPQRLTSPYNSWKGDEPLGGYAQKGFSGVKSRDEDGKGFEAIEFRTQELWGENAPISLDRLTNNAKYIGGAVLSFQKIPMTDRDKIISLELDGKFEEAEKIVETCTEYTLPKDKDLALQWLKLRKEVIDIFNNHGLTNPGHEYWGTEFRQLAAVLELESRKLVEGEKNMISEIRSLATKYRRKIIQILDSDK